jgi:hypothetical protein
LATVGERPGAGGVCVVVPVAFRVRFHDRFAYRVYTAFLAFQNGCAGLVVVLGGWWGAIWASPSPLLLFERTLMSRTAYG